MAEGWGTEEGGNLGIQDEILFGLQVVPNVLGFWKPVFTECFSSWCFPEWMNGGVGGTRLAQGCGLCCRWRRLFVHLSYISIGAGAKGFWCKVGYGILGSLWIAGSKDSFVGAQRRQVDLEVVSKQKILFDPVLFAPCL